MLTIECPWCGPCVEAEFRCGGQSHIQRPGPHDQVSDEAWADYLFYRNNPKGVEYERWVHRFGCRQWFNVVRSTVTHEILSVYKMTDPKPETGKGAA